MVEGRDFQGGYLSWQTSSSREAALCVPQPPVSAAGNVLALVPARGGSKGVPRKNVRLLGPKPAIHWTIAAARESRCCRIMVSTDDDEIASVAQAAGADVPFRRPEALATDSASSVDVAVHAVQWLEQHEGKCPPWLLLLQPTSPLRTGEDVLGVLEMQRCSGAPAVVSVCDASHPPSWFYYVDEHSRLRPILDNPGVARRQDYGPIVQLNGAVYLVKADVLLRERTFFPPGTVAYRMPVERSLDIDTPWDFHLADLILRTRDQARL